MLKADPTQMHLAGQWSADRPLTSCRFDPQGKFLLAGAEDYDVHRWDVATNKLVTLSGHESWVRAMGFSPDGQSFYSGGYDGQLIWWPLAADKPRPVRKIAGHQGWIRALAVHPAGTLVATCGNDRLVKVWNSADGKLVHELAGHTSHVYNVAFHPDGHGLVSCDLLGNFRHWNLDRGKLEREFSAEALHKYDTQFKADIGGARDLVFWPDGKLLAAGGMANVTNAFAGIGNAVVVVIDWLTGKPKIQHKAKELVDGTAWGVEPHPDGYWIGLSGGRTVGAVYFWKLGEPTEFFSFKLTAPGRGLSLHSGRVCSLAVAHADNVVRMYRLAKK